jgi:hypothetical protein
MKGVCFVDLATLERVFTNVIINKFFSERGFKNLLTPQAPAIIY